MKEISVQNPYNCPFRERNEETGELWCGQAEDLDCYDDVFMPQECPLLKSPIIVKAV